MADIDHEFTDEVVCPHCGHEHMDSWEMDDEGECQCYKCEKEFFMIRNRRITYSTKKLT